MLYRELKKIQFLANFITDEKETLSEYSINLTSFY